MSFETARALAQARSFGLCEGCRAMTTLDPHHRMTRGSGGVHRAAAEVSNDPRNLLMLCLGALLGAAIYLISTTLQQVAGFSPRETGLAMLPMGLALAATRLVFTKIVGAGGSQRLPLWGALFAATGLAWLGLLPAQADFIPHVLGPTLMVGAGLGTVILKATHAVTSGVPMQDAGLASGLANTARQLGGALGVAALATLVGAVAQGQPQGTSAPAALLAGAHAAFFGAASIAVLCGLITLRLQRDVAGELKYRKMR
jgi:predicted MFS family arabinose efflux permease